MKIVSLGAYEGKKLAHNRRRGGGGGGGGKKKRRRGKSFHELPALCVYSFLSR